MKMRRHLLLILSCFAIGAAMADAVSLSDAGRAVSNWLRHDPSLGCGLRGGIRASRTCKTIGGADFHVVRLTEGGFVVTAADTSLEPVLAFSDSEDLVEDERNPLWVLLRKDIDERLSCNMNVATTGAVRKVNLAAGVPTPESKWAKLLDDGSGANAKLMAKVNNAASLQSVSDVRVAPLVKSKWDQSLVGSKKCYNRFTPNNYVCGCVATAGAQIMRYFEYPKRAVEVFTNQYCFVDGVETTLVTQGGVYDWANMPLVPTSSITDAECDAIGKLTSDLGIICGMSYAKGGSGVGGYMLSRALAWHLGYANAFVYQREGNLSADIVRNAFISNFDAGLPVAISIDGPNGGHEIVGDGYGYSDGTLYYHLNMGWSGTGNAWYAPPNISAGGNTFNALNGFVYNIYTNFSHQCDIICSGRVLGSNGLPLSGASVSIYNNSGKLLHTVTSGPNGVYATFVPGGAYQYSRHRLCATLGTAVAEKYVSLISAITTSTTEDGYYYPSTGRMSNVCDNDLVLSVEGELPVVPPEVEPAVPEGASVGDYFGKPIVISGASGSHRLADTSTFTIEDDEPLHSERYGEARSAWYRWVAPGTGRITFKALSRAVVTSGSTVSTYYLYVFPAVYVGKTLATANKIAGFTSLDASNGTTVSFDAEQGQTYMIAVSAYIGNEMVGYYDLSWSGNLKTKGGLVIFVR